MKTTKIAIAATLALSFLPISSAVAADAAEEGLKVKFDEMTCGEMLIQTGSSRDFTMIFMHGVINGMKKNFVFDAVKVSEATDEVYSMCVADTDANLLKVFEKARS